jgi:hypothetical protein
MEVNGKSYEVSLTGINSADNPDASIVVNGESDTFGESDTKTISFSDGTEIDVFVRTIFKTGDNAGYVIVELGSDKLVLEDGKRVKMGADEEYVDGTRVTITGGVGAVSTLEIDIGAQDDDMDNLEVGESFLDPVFGTVRVDLTKILNAPEIDGDTGEDISTTRRVVEVTRASDNTLQVTFEEKNGETATIEFADGVTAGSIALEDDDDEPIVVVEGSPVGESDYVVINDANGDTTHFAQVEELTFDADDGTTLVLVDQFGVKSDEGFENEGRLMNNGSTISENIWGNTYTVELVSNDTTTPQIAIYTSDMSYPPVDGDTVKVYPYIKTISGTDHKIAFTDSVKVLDDTTADDDGTVETITLSLPTGEVDVEESDTNSSLDVDGNTIASGADLGILVGTVWYVFAVSNNSAATADLTVSVGTAQNGSTDVANANAGILYVEEEDDSETTSNTYNAVIIPTTGDGDFIEVDLSNIAFTATEISEVFADSDYTGEIDPFGAYVVKDSSDNDQAFATLTYPENQMYAEVFISEASATITPGETGLIPVYNDNEMSKYEDTNILIVGGSCINSAAAMVLGSENPICGDAFTAATGVGAGQYIIKTVASPYNAAKIAMLVAGYEATDTLNAVAKAKEGVSTDVGTEQIYPKLTA